jgi:hypothetical protein
MGLKPGERKEIRLNELLLRRQAAQPERGLQQKRRTGMQSTQETELTDRSDFYWREWLPTILLTVKSAGIRR